MRRAPAATNRMAADLVPAEPRGNAFVTKLLTAAAVFTVILNIALTDGVWLATTRQPVQQSSQSILTSESVEDRPAQRLALARRPNMGIDKAAAHPLLQDDPVARLHFGDDKDRRSVSALTKNRPRRLDPGALDRESAADAQERDGGEAKLDDSARTSDSSRRQQGSLDQRSGSRQLDASRSSKKQSRVSVEDFRSLIGQIDQADANSQDISRLRQNLRHAANSAGLDLGQAQPEDDDEYMQEDAADEAWERFGDEVEEAPAPPPPPPPDVSYPVDTLPFNVAEADSDDLALSVGEQSERARLLDFNRKFSFAADADKPQWPRLCVFSYSGNQTQRAMFRKMAQPYVAMQVFVLDSKDAYDEDESDLLRLPFEAGFRQLYAKAREAFRYYQQRIEQCDWISQMNDDMYFNWPYLMDILAARAGMNISIYAGHMLYFAPETRRDGKQYAAGQNLEFATYANGPVYFLNQHLFRLMGEYPASKIYQRSHVEDASLGLFFRDTFKHDMLFYDLHGLMFGKYMDPPYNDTCYYLAVHNQRTGYPPPCNVSRTVAAVSGTWFYRRAEDQQVHRLNPQQLLTALGPTFDAARLPQSQNTRLVIKDVDDASSIFVLGDKSQKYSQPKGPHPFEEPPMPDTVNYRSYGWEKAIRMVAKARGVFFIVGRVHQPRLLEIARHHTSLRTVVFPCHSANITLPANTDDIHDHPSNGSARRTAFILHDLQHGIFVDSRCPVNMRGSDPWRQLFEEYGVVDDAYAAVFASADEKAQQLTLRNHARLRLARGQSLPWIISCGSGRPDKRFSLYMLRREYGRARYSYMFNCAFLEPMPSLSVKIGPEHVMTE